MTVRPTFSRNIAAPKGTLLAENVRLFPPKIFDTGDVAWDRKVGAQVFEPHLRGLGRVILVADDLVDPPESRLEVDCPSDKCNVARTVNVAI